MSVAPSLAIVDLPNLDDLVEEIRAGHEECEALFADLLDQWDQACELAAACERAAAVVPATADRESVHDPRLDHVLHLLEELAQRQTCDADRFQELENRWAQSFAQDQERVAAQAESILQQILSVTQVWQQCQVALNELHVGDGRSEASDDLLRKMAVLEDERRQAEMERRELEVELEAVRNRAAELAENLVRQQTDQSLQQSQWGDELRRMRSTMEDALRRIAESALAAADPQNEIPVSTHDTPQLPAVGAESKQADPVLDSVMAQFEMLQRDIAKRRAHKR